MLAKGGAAGFWLTAIGVASARGVVVVVAGLDGELQLDFGAAGSGVAAGLDGLDHPDPDGFAAGVAVVVAAGLDGLDQDDGLAAGVDAGFDGLDQLEPDEDLAGGPAWASVTPTRAKASTLNQNFLIASFLVREPGRGDDEAQNESETMVAAEPPGPGVNPTLCTPRKEQWQEQPTEHEKHETDHSLFSLSRMPRIRRQTDSGDQ